MCDIIQERIRINQILTLIVDARLDDRPVNLDEMTRLCVEALQLYYEGACPEECTLAKAGNFAAWQMALHETRLAQQKPTGLSALAAE